MLTITEHNIRNVILHAQSLTLLRQSKRARHSEDQNQRIKNNTRHKTQHAACTIVNDTKMAKSIQYLTCVLVSA